MTAGAVGAVVGGIGMSIWGGFKRRVHGVLGGWILSGLGFAMLGLGQTLPVWVFFSALSSLVGPLVNASNQSIWMAKVAPDVQGRVFSARRLIAWSTQPIAPIIGGTLADFVLEPAMMGTGTMATVFGPLVGTTSGSGMSLLIFFCGMGAAVVGAAGYYFSAIRNAEDILPDHDTMARVEPDCGASLGTDQMGAVKPLPFFIFMCGIRTTVYRGQSADESCVHRGGTPAGMVNEPADGVGDRVLQRARVVSQLAGGFGVTDVRVALQHLQRIRCKTRRGVRQSIIERCKH